MVRVGSHDVDLAGDRVTVRLEGRVVATARWREGHVVECMGNAEWDAIEHVIRADSARRDEATMSAAYDARGSDLTQIDGMLAMTPRERLAVLEGQCRSLLRLMSHGPPHRDV